jgi:hypothetical protein
LLLCLSLEGWAEVPSGWGHGYTPVTAVSDSCTSEKPTGLSFWLGGSWVCVWCVNQLWGGKEATGSIRGPALSHSQRYPWTVFSWVKGNSFDPVTVLIVSDPFLLRQLVQKLMLGKLIPTAMGLWWEVVSIQVV